MWLSACSWPNCLVDVHRRSLPVMMISYLYDRRGASEIVTGCALTARSPAATGAQRARKLDAALAPDEQSREREGSRAFPVAAAWSPADDAVAAASAAPPTRSGRPGGWSSTAAPVSARLATRTAHPRRARRSLEAAAILAGGGSALDAVEAAVRVLEDDPHFNAGRGSVFTYQGTIEMDASIMDGATAMPARSPASPRPATRSASPGG